MSPAIQELDRSPDRRIEAIRMQLKELGHLWIGEDLRVARDYRLEPGETTQIEVILPENSLPPIDYDEGDIRALLREMSISIRSRLALSGLDGEELKALKRRSQEGEIRATLKVSVLGGRPINLIREAGVGCLCGPHGARRLRGEELYQKVVEEQKMRIGGVFGEEWCLVGQGNFLIRDEKLASLASGVGLRLKDKRFRIPEGTEPINVCGVDNYRDYLDRHVFVEMGSEEHGSFWVGETRSVVEIPSGYNGFLSSMANAGRHWVIQTNSYLIIGGKGGKTKWPLRSEFHNPMFGNTNLSSPISGDYRNQYLVMRVFEDRRLASQ